MKKLQKHCSAVHIDHSSIDSGRCRLRLRILHTLLTVEHGATVLEISTALPVQKLAKNGNEHHLKHAEPKQFIRGALLPYELSEVEGVDEPDEDDEPHPMPPLPVLQDEGPDVLRCPLELLGDLAHLGRCERSHRVPQPFGHDTKEKGYIKHHCYFHVLELLASKRIISIDF